MAGHFFVGLLAMSALFLTNTAHSFVMGYDHSLRANLFIGGRSSGHEEITRQAMIMVRDELGLIGIYPELGNEDIFGDLDPHTFGTKGASSPNMIIQGNWATDFKMPAKGMRYPINLVKFWGFPKRVKEWKTPDEVDWHNNPEGQSIHGLRNYVDGQLDSPYNTCREVRDKLDYVTMEAVKYWMSGDRVRGAFLLGHGTHILQDTFSPAHTVRSTGTYGFVMTDMCYYGKDQKEKLEKQNPNAKDCYHAAFDFRDGIYIRNKEEFDATKIHWTADTTRPTWIGNFDPPYFGFVPESLKETTLKLEARLAKVATARYLYIVAKYLSEVADKSIDWYPAAVESDPDFKILKTRLEYGLYDGSLTLFNKTMSETLPIGALRCHALRK